jgi:hypothetical protein
MIMGCVFFEARTPYLNTVIDTSFIFRWLIVSLIVDPEFRRGSALVSFTAREVGCSRQIFHMRVREGTFQREVTL